MSNELLDALSHVVVSLETMGHDGSRLDCEHCKTMLEARAAIANHERASSPSELEMHRSAHRAIKEAGFESPEELLAAYNKLITGAREVLDTRNDEARSYLELENARENYTTSDDYAEAHSAAMVNASEAERRLRIVLNTLDGPTLMQKAIDRDSRHTKPPTAPPTSETPGAQEPVAWLWEYLGMDAYSVAMNKGGVARTIREMDPANPPYPLHWKAVQPLYAAPPPNARIAELEAMVLEFCTASDYYGDEFWNTYDALVERARKLLETRA